VLFEIRFKDKVVTCFCGFLKDMCHDLHGGNRQPDVLLTVGKAYGITENFLDFVLVLDYFLCL
jgi:hypothetical protein